MRVAVSYRVVRMSAVAAAAVAVVVSGVGAPASATERPDAPAAKTFRSHALKNSAELDLKVGGKGVVKRWSVIDGCGTKLKGTKLRFQHSRLKATRKVDGRKVTLHLRVASKRLVVGKVTIKGTDRHCSGTFAVVAGTKGAWKSKGEAVAANTLLAHTPVIDWVARDYKQRHGRFPGSKAQLVRHVKRLGVMSSKRFGERVTAYTANDIGYVVTIGAKRGTDVRIMSSWDGRVGWAL